MDGERPHAIFHRLQRLAEKFHDKIYRDGYVASHTRGVLAQQMRNFRGDLSQAEFAATLDKQKTVIGRLENPAYSGWSISTMLEVARKRDVAVFCRFVDFPTFLKLSDDLSDSALCPTAYDQAELGKALQEVPPRISANGSSTLGGLPPEIMRAYERLMREGGVIPEEQQATGWTVITVSKENRGITITTKTDTSPLQSAANTGLGYMVLPERLSHV